MKEQFDQKILHFAAALSDVYKEDDEKEGLSLAPLELTEDFTAMIYAQWALYRKVTGDDIDILGFTHLVNRLVFQQVMKDNGVLQN
ncbi:hypothetical protein [Enterocloster citroniae]|uniref:hypothetical protein n=1 Tax=Enterocloster citroniae TaxID=358743 RepID=UPI0034A18DF5